MTHDSQGAVLSHELVELMMVASGLLGEEAAVLHAQADAAVVTSQSSTMIDVTLWQPVPLLSVKDGPLPTRAIVYKDDRPIGEVVLWVKSGLITGIEQAWFTEEAPTHWPSTSDLRLQ